MKQIIIILPILIMSLFCSTLLVGQENVKEEINLGISDFNNESHKEIGLNFTQFIGQFVPFNIKEVKDGPIGYSFKRYNNKGVAFRFGFGSSIKFDDEDSFISIRIGYERRKKLSKRIYYTRGWDLLSVVGSFNLPNRDRNGINAGLGIGPVIGLEYHLTNALVLSTESMLFVGFREVGPVINIIPPTAIFLNFRF